jgi:parallel beta-helix repeat protein
METKQLKLIVSVLALAMLTLPSAICHADDPRIAISSVPYTITGSGSYYLTDDLQIPSADDNAIHIDANNVTLDLMGFSLIGHAWSGNGCGIIISGQKNVEIRNGTVREFGGDGIYEDDGEAHRLIDVRVIDNAGIGIDLGGVDHLVRSSTFLGNGFGGIFVGSNSLIKDCKISFNFGHGIELSSKCTVLANVVDFNLLSGIWTWSHCVVIDNVVSDNFQQGIFVDGDYSQIKRNTLTENLENNILVDGSGNAIEENFVCGSNCGIRIEKSGNFYANNRATENGTDYIIAPTNADDGGNVSF